MGLFRRKKEVDTRTELEKTMEEKGKNAGIKAGRLLQKGVNKSKKINEKIKGTEKIEKVKEFAAKADKKLDQTVDKVVEKGKEIISNRKNKDVIE